MKALEKIPRGLQKELAGHSLKTQNNAAAIFDLLDRKAGPVKAKAVQEELDLTPYAYRNACRLLAETSVDLYYTQEGVVLKKYLSADEERYWHLAWSLGSFEVSGKQLTLDRDLLKRVPAAIEKLIVDKKLTQASRLEALRTRSKQAIAILMDVLDMYQEVNRALEVAALPEVTGKNWKPTLAKIKSELKALPPRRR
ncbi:MAG TPA: hypothetical protein VLB46_11610 [Pyrinomonadaceae bacterium]|nr:hypothetical protein [Pyrinomonadaceae bacterium]